MILIVILLIPTVVIIGCGGGGGGSSSSTSSDSSSPIAPAPAADEVSVAPSVELQASTTYYWKIVTTDPNGNETETDVRTFKTK